MTTNNDAFAEALAEIEDGRLDKGAWARAYAESGGDESKAKAFYIKARAKSITTAEAWPNTQPPFEDAPTYHAKPASAPTIPAGDQAKFYEAAIGQKNLDYYLNKFHTFDEKGPGLHASWNWAAFFMLPWLLYRKMYGWFFAWSIVFTVLSIFNTVPEVKGLGALKLAVVTLGLCFVVFANSLYHRKIKARIAAAHRPNCDGAQVTRKLSGKGGVNNWVIYVFGAIPVIGIVMAVVLPAFQDYSKRRAAPVQTPVSQESPGKQGQAESSEFTSFRQKVGTISTRIERGELPSMDGIALNLAPNGYFSGSTAEGKLLESTQTWWSIDGKNHIHIRNVTANPLSAVTLEYSQVDCSQSADVTRFFLIFTNSIPAGGEAVINFEYSLDLGKTFPSCLTISSPLQAGFQQSTKTSPLPSAQGAATSPGVQHSPSPPSKAEMAAMKNYELQQQTKSAKENADLNEAAERAVRDFPYLDTPDGAKVLEKIVARRNELIQEGTHPALALTRAVNQYAAANAPQAPGKRGGDAKPVQPTQNQNTDVSGCRWVTPQQWSCK